MLKEAHLRNKILIIVAICILTAGLAIAYWRWPHSVAQQGTLVLYGNLDIRQVDLGFGVDGPIARILVEEGDRVKQGQTLALLEEEPFIDAVQAAEVTLKLAEARQAEGVHGPRPQEIEGARRRKSGRGTIGKCCPDR